MNIRNTIFGPGLWAVAASASALSLGGGSGAVVLGAPVDLSFELQPDLGTDVASSCVTARLVAGDTVIGDSKVRVVPLPAVRGRPAGVRVTASVAVDEPVLTVTLSAGCVGKTTRTYTFLSELPTTVPRYSSASPVDVSRLRNVAGAAGAAGLGSTGAAGATPSTPGNSNPRLAAGKQGLEPKEAANAPVRSTAPVKPPKRVPALASDKNGPSASQKPSAVPPVSGRARLVLEPLDTWLESPVTLRSSSELLMAPSPEVSTQRTQAAALWKSLNAQPEDLQKDSERLQKLEVDAAAARQQATKHQADAAQLRGQLEQVEQERFPAMVVYALGAVLLLALLLAVWLWTRLRRTSQMAVSAWRDSVDMGSREAVAAHEAALGLAPHPADAWAPPETLPTPDDALAPSRPAPISTDSRTPFLATKPGVVAASSAVSAAPVFVAKPSVMHIVNPEQLFDIQQQAEFFISVGEHQQAIEVLKKHIAEYRESSPLAYLELLRIYHTLSRVEDFSQLRSQFMQFFNAQVPDFSGFHRTGRMLYHYTESLAAIEAAWTSEAVLPLLETLLFRRSDRQAVEPFDLAAYDDLLLLLAIAQTTLPSARGAAPPRARTTPASAPMVESLVHEAPSAVLSPLDVPLDSLAASLEFDFDLIPQRAEPEPSASSAPVPPAGRASREARDIPLDLDLSEPVHLTLSDLPAVPVSAAPAAGQPVGFGMNNDLMELRLELEQKKSDDK